MRWPLLVVLAAGCLQPRSHTCGDKVCAPEARCDEPTSTCIPAGCGDGVVNNKEQCDGAAFGNVVDCTSLGFYDHHPVSCTIACEIDQSQCEESCGDHVVDGPELCDGTPPRGQSCLDYGFGAGRIACAQSCTPSFEACTPLGLVLEAPFATSLNAVDGRAPDDAFAVGNAGQVVHFDGAHWTPMAVSSLGAFSALWIDKSPGGKVVIAVGNDGAGHGLVGYYDGTAWTTAVVSDVVALHGVWGRSPSDVWAVGEGTANGQAVHFDGAAWSAATMVSLAALRAVTGDASSSRVVAVGDTGTTAVYDGASWSFSSTGCSDCTADAGGAFNYLTVTAIGSPPQYIAAGTSRPLHFAVVASSADGASWSSLHQDRTLGTFTSTSGVPGDVYLTGSLGALIRYDGKAFHSVVTGSIANITGVWRGTADDVHAVLNSGEIRRLAAASWDDAGSILADDVRLQAVATSPAGEMIAVGDVNATSSTLLSTLDGVHWAEQTLTGASGVNLSGAAFGPTCDAYVSASNQKLGVFARSGGSCTTQPTTFSQISMAPPSGLSLQTLFALPTGDLYAGTLAAQVIHGTNTTTAWSTATLAAAGENVNSIWGSSPTDVYAAGDSGLLAHTSDGTTWTPVGVPGLTDPLQGVWGSGPNDVFVVSARGLIVHFDGATWRTQHNAPNSLAGVIGVAVPDPAHPGTNLRATDVFAFGTDTLLHYDGVSWSPVEIPVQFSIAAAANVLATGRNDVIFVGAHGNAVTLDRPLAAKETRCSDGWDDDRDGLVDCADPDCWGTDTCKVTGGACHATGTLACGAEIDATTFTGVARLDTLPMLDGITDGTEAVYRFEAPASGAVELTLTSQQPLSLVVTETYPQTAACNLDAPVAAHAGAGTLSFQATAGTTYAIIIDEAAGSGGAFQLSASCPM